VIKEDALLGTFLAEPSFEKWRKQSSISLEEESASKRIDRVEEMTIPSDLEDKLGYVHHFFPHHNLCSNWTPATRPLGTSDKRSFP
jgi:sorting nexin-8